MSRKLITLFCLALSAAPVARADAPRVAVDIAPVHSLVARVMEGVGNPSLIVSPGASPHEYSLRPSEARALQEADLVFWISPDLTPWMAKAIETLSDTAVVTELLEADGTTTLPIREDALFEAHDHGEDHAAEEAAHDDHDHASESKEAHDHEDHASEEKRDHDHAHDHGAHDAHAWLYPGNAAAWLNVIAAQLSAVDPRNAGAYFANAAEGRAEIEALTVEINALLDPVRGARFVVFHDAYQYFEVGFEFPASGAISLSDASDPSPARIAQIQTRIAEEGIDCVLAEPQFNPDLVATVLGDTAAKTGVLDPLGSDLEPGPALYPTLMRNLGAELAGCL